jgi:hypothetical protein
MSLSSVLLLLLLLFIAAVLAAKRGLEGDSCRGKMKMK